MHNEPIPSPSSVIAVMMALAGRFGHLKCYLIVAYQLFNVIETPQGLCEGWPYAGLGGFQSTKQLQMKGLFQNCYWSAIVAPPALAWLCCPTASTFSAHITRPWCQSHAWNSWPHSVVFWGAWWFLRLLTPTEVSCGSLLRNRTGTLWQAWKIYKAQHNFRLGSRRIY